MKLAKNKKIIGVGVGLVVLVATLLVTTKSGTIPKSPFSSNIADQYRSVPADPAQSIPGLAPLAPIQTDFGAKLKVLTLTDSNTVEFEEEVTYESSKRLISKIKSMQNTDRIYLLITSPGGSVLAGAMVLETIQGSKIPVDTVCVGICASMGAQIHAVGSHRYMTNKSVLMYHPASGGVQGDFNVMESRIAFYKRYVAKMDMYIAERANIPYEQFKARVRDELWIDAQDATSDGFNDNVVYLDDKRSPPEGSIMFLVPGSENRKSRKDPMDTYFQTEKSKDNDQEDRTKSN